MVFFILTILTTSGFGDDFKQDALADTMLNGYISIDNKFTYINDQFAVINGMKLALIIDHAWVIGGGMWMLSNNISGNASYQDNELDLVYGGLWLEYIFFSDKVIHFSIGFATGIGGCGFTNITEISDTVFILEPEIYISFNITYNIRLSLGVGYRFVADVNLPSISNNDLRGITANVVIRFGQF